MGFAIRLRAATKHEIAADLDRDFEGCQDD
jgi:hypothetical protein